MGSHAAGRRIVLMRKNRRRTKAACPSGLPRAVACLLLAGAFLRAPVASGADPEGRTPASFELPRGRSSLGLRGTVSESPPELRFWSCPDRGPCPESQPSVSVPLPGGMKGASFEQRVLTIEGIPLLSLALEGPEKSFHVLVAPGARGADGAKLSILLARELRPGEALRVSPDGQLLTDRQVRACDDPTGRELFVSVRRLDLKRREFVRARHSLLGDAEAAQAEPLEAVETARALPEAIVPLTGSTSEGSSWAIGEAEGAVPWAELAFRAGGRKKIQLELEPGAEAELFLIRPDRILRVRVPSSETSRSFALPLAEAGRDVSGDCFLLATGKSGAPLRSVALSDDQKPFGSPESWVRELSGPEPTTYQNALRSEAEAAARAIESEFVQLDSAGRARAIEILSELPGEFALSPLITVAALGVEVERERAFGELAEYEPEVVFVRAEQSFSGSHGRRAPGVALVMAHFGPEAALPKIAARLAEPRRRSKNIKQQTEELAIRKELRAALSVAVSKVPRPRELERILASKELEPAARLELLRALGPRRRVLGFSLAPYVAELGTSFQAHYVLLELELELFAELPGDRRDRLLARLGARSDSTLKPVELLAYQARMLELLTERDLPRETLAHFRKGAFLGLDSSSRVVRQAALVFLRGSETRATNAEAARILRLVDEDEWVEVRAEAAITFGSLAALLAESARDAQEEELEQRLKPNRADPIVSRALVRALGKSGGPRARAALGAVFERKGLPEARADAAEVLGRLCEQSVIPSLTEHALRLQSPTSESDVTIGLASVRALAWLGPADLDRRLAPLTTEKVPGPIRGQVAMILESAPAARCASE